MSTHQNLPPQPAPDGHGAGRKAFIFYSKWYSDARRGLDDAQLAEFVLVIIRYASEGAEPDDATTPIVRMMFELIRNVIDKDLAKYEEMVEINRLKAEASVENRRSAIRRLTVEKTAQESLAPSVVEVVDNEQSQCIEPIHNTQYTEHNTQNSREKGEEEARGEMLVQREEVEAYWREHHYRSDVDEFFDYYARRHWITSRGIRLRSWKRAAVMWEDKYCRDVLPVRRREARAQAAVEAENVSNRRATEAAAQRRDERARREAEADRAARRRVSPELGKHMYQRAMLLANGDDALAMNLMQRAPDDPSVFKRLAEGYRGAATQATA